jgi:hypothetical protein
MKTIKILLLVAGLAAFCASCKKDKSEPEPDPVKPSPYFIRMTDAPGPYTAVNIDFQGVELNGNGHAVTLKVNPGIYNLLNFSNGLDTLIATGSLDVEKVEQIRLILGPNNTVVKNGTTYTLSTPSAQQSGLKLQVHQQLQAGVAYYVLLDFDANQSIVEEGNGSYSLKPVIRTIETALSGSIKGKISPTGVAANVTASSGSNSYSSVVNANSDFIISGLPAGAYSLTVTPVFPYNTATLTNVSVSTGSTTSVGTLNI